MAAKESGEGQAAVLADRNVPARNPVVGARYSAPAVRPSLMVSPRIWGL